MSIFDQPERPYEFIKSTPQNIGSIQHFTEATFGAGETSIVQIDSEGAKFGSRILADAKAYIKTDGSFKFKNSAGTTIIDSLGAGGNFINVINANLNTTTKKVLSDFTFGSTDYSGAFKTGDITWNATTGAITGGSGSVYNKKGLIFANAGVATLTLDGETGNATFAGTLSAAAGTLGTITSATITGGTITGVTITGATIQTATSGYRVKLSTSGLQFLSSDTVKGSIGTDAIGSLVYYSADNHYFRDGSTELARFNSNGLYLASGKRLEWSSGRDITENGSGWSVDGDWNPDADKGQSMGSADYRWNHITADIFYQSTNTDGSRHVYDAAYIEINLIPKKLLKKLEKLNNGVECSNGYINGLKLPYKKGTVLKWTSKGLKECEKETDFAIAIASDKGLPIVLGAEPVRIIGKAKIGDFIVTSNVKGCAMAVSKNPVNEIIGRCLENKKDEKEKLINVMVKF